MAATVTIRVNTETDAGTQSGAQTGIDLISADNALNTIGNRTGNPITAGNRSYEKWVTARVDVAPDNACNNFKFWTDGTVQTETTLYGGTTATGVTPTDSASSVATTDATTWTSGAKYTWHAGNLTAIGHVTDFMVLQLATTGSATAGNWTQETLSYSYDET